MTDTTTLDAESPIEVGSPADWDDIAALLGVVFHSMPDDPQAAAGQAITEPDRSLLIRSGDAVVAHAAAFTRDLTVPGAVVPAAHVTRVAVAPTHRRQGLLTRLMRRQLHDIRAAGREPIAVLWASEGPIYPRFGYGQATQRWQLEVETTGLRLAELGRDGSSPAITLRTGDPVALQPALAAVYDRLRPDRPGWSSRTDPWWRYLLADGPGQWCGATVRRAVLADRSPGPAGYALWRTRPEWDARGPQGSVIIDEVVAADPEAYHTLWRFLLGLDLTRKVHYHFAAVDEPVQHLVGEPRQLGARLGHGLWARIVDLPAALAARRYATGVDVVLEVTDPLLTENAGRWRLTAASGAARCTRSDAPAELACDVRDLAAAYLGGPTLGALAAAGRVREVRSGALARASAAFGWHRAPAGLAIF